MDSGSWNLNTGNTATNAVRSIEAGGGSGGDQASHALYTMPMMSFGMPTRSSPRWQNGLQDHDMQDAMGQPHSNASVELSSNHLLLAAKWFRQQRLQKALASSNANASYAADLQIHDHILPPSHGVQEATKIALKRILEGSLGTAGLNESLMVGSNGSGLSSPPQISCDTLLPHLITPTGHPPYLQEVLSLSPGIGQAKRQDLFFQASSELHKSMLDTLDGVAAQANQVQDAIWHSHSQVSHGVLVPSFASHSSLNQPQDSCGAGGGAPRPRVRARRGQATDPHSIAERLRRERIAERMKLLQELVPSTNKTDKAVMLDEVIAYVKFLLLQVKVLSMSRLGGAGLVVPLVAGLPEGKSMHMPTAVQDEASGPCHDSMLGVEEHVARLITGNVGAAMQFLQMKGLCLMPMSLAKINPSTDASLSLTNQTCVPDQSNSSSMTTIPSKCLMQT